ncbi:50S ribosomal protein L3 N(5)-glutamine methyltransferase [Sinimarinibacterium sp. CAU 1509]|uniref:50S ribosomal protein L3 N(5)-glutamine methyltransferase n=1 Tax=Sinimarinibacterium sp. CAU 1509 TaxID=2562283 RepID=UPI0010ACFE63|nr:50S ribosomal protein L3 N(5)-glutamine methyltransferase [Sinimarinibacterium sp. CAU 1509]TJY62226.1 50S ribosomal protein L3 N(5)-glutamine methyltransferase [Sinimarinibacterium sp. CAU 1509]
MIRRFETDALNTVRDLVRWGASRFREAGLHYGHGTDNALDEAYFLTLWALHLPMDLPAIYLESTVTSAERSAVIKLLRSRIATRKPAAYLIGEIEFAGMPFFVDDRVLVPRSPIGELIRRDFEPWLQGAPERILDLCTGSGCIGIACASQYPQSEVDLADISSGALAVARKNIKRHGLEQRVRAVRSDVYDGLGDATYDLIVTNPPYVGTAEWKGLPEEYRHEPRIALEAGSDGMDIVERILTGAPERLRPGGLLICEVGDSVEEFDARWPRLPVTWIEFEHGGDGVFLISREDLVASL